MHGPSARRRWQMGLQEDGGNAYLPGWPENAGILQQSFPRCQKEAPANEGAHAHSELLFSIEVTG